MPDPNTWRWSYLLLRPGRDILRRCQEVPAEIHLAWSGTLIASPLENAFKGEEVPWALARKLAW